MPSDKFPRLQRKLFMEGVRTRNDRDQSVLSVSRWILPLCVIEGLEFKGAIAAIEFYQVSMLSC